MATSNPTPIYTSLTDVIGRNNGKRVSAWSEQVAADMLSQDGLAAVWQLHLSATRAYREGNELAARLMIDIADAAERLWLRRSKDNRTG